MPKSSFSAKSGGSFSMRSRTYVKKTFDNPPPNHYCPKPPKRVGDITMAGRPVVKSLDETPAPCHYDIQ